MPDNTKTIVATFDTREAADAAIEHLVQQQGIDRPDIFVQAEGRENTAGTAPSGGDNAHDGGDREDSVLQGEIEVSVDISADQLSAVQRMLGDSGALRVSTK
jgi:hypothetical protein